MTAFRRLELHTVLKHKGSTVHNLGKSSLGGIQKFINEKFRSSSLEIGGVGFRDKFSLETLKDE